MCLTGRTEVILDADVQFSAWPTHSRDFEPAAATPG
jgi:hypothetical protein